MPTPIHTGSKNPVASGLSEGTLSEYPDCVDRDVGGLETRITQVFACTGGESQRIGIGASDKLSELVLVNRREIARTWHSLRSALGIEMATRDCAARPPKQKSNAICICLGEIIEVESLRPVHRTDWRPQLPVNILYRWLGVIKTNPLTDQAPATQLGRRQRETKMAHFEPFAAEDKLKWRIEELFAISRQF